MQPISLEPLADDDKALTTALVQVMQYLGLYQAELARVLGLQYAEVAELVSARRFLHPDTPEYRRAQQFVRLYELLYRHFDGEPVAMYHWLRVRMAPTYTTPLMLMVDEGRIGELIDWFEASLGE
jgi:hypothetical protein